jgi:hypothetical protein
MPNGDSWQGDLLRDLRGGAQQGAQGPGGQAHGVPVPNPGFPAQRDQAPTAPQGQGTPPQAGHPYPGEQG